MLWLYKPWSCPWRPIRLRHRLPIVVYFPPTPLYTIPQPKSKANAGGVTLIGGRRVGNVDSRWLSGPFSLSADQGRRPTPDGRPQPHLRRAHLFQAFPSQCNAPKTLAINMDIDGVAIDSIYAAPCFAFCVLWYIGRESNTCQGQRAGQQRGCSTRN